MKVKEKIEQMESEIDSALVMCDKIHKVGNIYIPSDRISDDLEVLRAKVVTENQYITPEKTLVITVSEEVRRVKASKRSSNEVWDNMYLWVTDGTYNKKGEVITAFINRFSDFQKAYEYAYRLWEEHCDNLATDHIVKIYEARIGEELEMVEYDKGILVAFEVDDVERGE